MPIPNGEIQFSPFTVLRVDGSILEHLSVTPTELHNYLISSADTIAAHVEAKYERDIQMARNPEKKLRRVIQVARLAMHQWDNTIFSLSGQYLERVTLLKDGLTPLALSYWEAVSDTSFTPEIHIRGMRAEEDTRGVWLSLKIRNK